MITRDERIGLLFDLLEYARPDGLTLVEITRCLPYTYNPSTVKTAIHDLRHLLANDMINVIVEPPEYQYRLVGTYEESRSYQNQRLRDLETRMSTQISIATSIYKGSPSGTPLRARAGVILDGLTATVERLRLIPEDQHIQ